jgi:hypothetical protein
LFREIAALIKACRASIVFIQVKGHSGNVHNNAADALAKEGARKLCVPNYIPSAVIPLGNTMNDKAPLFSDPKVLYRTLPKALKAALHAPGADHKSNLTAHRSRPALLALQLEHCKELLEAKTERDFWKVAKGMMTPKRPQSGFSAEALKDVFVTRMNPVLPMPESFDKERFDLNQSLNNAMPEHTVDVTPDLIFLTPFSEEEMGEAKDHLRQHPPTSARGYDQKSYADVCDLENDALCDLVNRCIHGNDAPSIWLLTVLVGLLKRGKPKSDPNSYRTIGLESCFLKLVTLLIHMRLTKWCMAVGMLPNS